MGSQCNQIQEEIAWGRPLPEDTKNHILSCAACGQVALEYARLDSLVSDHLNVQVPEKFADQVMSRIISAPIFEWKEWFLSLKPVRATLAYASVILTLLGVLVPMAAW